ncbi:MAG: hypothetical protein HeimC3_23900 [Candidatus Heimdallarchaeota archaeon LC_3]|nr:MAG: hypothetical protein HeimC3_23900 [Candidatus Heimdallarchaeota archaeon LC_3]
MLSVNSRAEFLGPDPEEKYLIEKRPELELIEIPNGTVIKNFDQFPVLIEEDVTKYGYQEQNNNEFIVINVSTNYGQKIYNLNQRIGSIEFYEILVILEGFSVIVLVIIATGSIVYEKKKLN